MKTAYAGAQSGEEGALDRILALDLGIRHLMICCGGTGFVVPPKRLSTLSSLTNVTLLAALNHTYPAHFLLSLPPLLPPTVRYLNLPQRPPH